MKSQGLPAQMIVLIVISLLVLSAALVFFFSSSKKGVSGVNYNQNFASCQAKCAQIVASADTKEECEDKAAAVNYCLYCSDYPCSKEGVWDKITCSDSSVTCS